MGLEQFIRAAWAITEPNKPFVNSWHIGYLAEMLTAVSLGQITKLLINIPPRWMKSTIVTVDWPCWEWGPFARPELRYMMVSYDQGLSTMHSLSRRAILESPWYRERWGDSVKLATDQNQKTFMQNTMRGQMIATSTHGGATGKGGDRLVFDDFLNPDEVESDTERESALAAYEHTFSTRLDDPKRGAMVVVEQRLHHKDFTAKVKAEGGWNHVVIPTDTVKGQELRFEFPISKREVVIPEATAVWPDREPMEVIGDKRRRMGSRRHDAQCRQNPSSEDGAIFKRARWRFYNEMPWRLDEGGKKVLIPADFVLQSWDCAFKDLDSSDFVVGTTWARFGPDRYLLDLYRDKMGIGATISAVEGAKQKWPGVFAIVIEDKANGPAVVELLKSRVPGLVLVNPEGGKIVRARAVEPLQEAGNLWLPSPAIAPWVEDFIAECAAFPNGENDDQVDSMTQANIYFTAHEPPSLSVM